MSTTPAPTDKFMKVGVPGTATTLSAPGYTSGDSGITVGSTTDWPTDTQTPFAIDRAQLVNGVESRIEGTYNEFTGIVTSSTAITSVVKTFGDDQDYPAGSLTRVYIPVTSTRENALIDGLAQDHNLKGNHKTLTDDNGNEWLERGQTASAVNQIKVTNATSGNKPIISSSGGDTNSSPSLRGKGTGLADIDGAVPIAFFALFNFIESGCIWSGDSYGSSLNGSMTSGIVWIGGRRLTRASISAHTFSASKDTYVDFQDNGDGTALVVYTEVSNNTASPVIPNSLTEAANIRVVIVVTAANIAAVGSVNQGQENILVPIVASRPYAVTDSLGYLINPRDPNRKLLGYAQLITNFVSGGSTMTDVAGLATPVYIPPSAQGRKIAIKAMADVYNAGGPAGNVLNIREGSTTLQAGVNQVSAANSPVNILIESTTSPTVGLHTYKASLNSTGGNTSIQSSAEFPFIKVVLE